MVETELLEAIKKFNQLKEDAEKINNWLIDAKFNKKPVVGQSWWKLENAINEVIEQLWEEYHELEPKIKAASNGIEI